MFRQLSMTFSNDHPVRSWRLLVICCVMVTSSCARRMAPPKLYLAFVAAHGCHCVAVVDLGNFRVVRIIPLDFAPQRLTERPHSFELYITSAEGQASIIRYPELTVVTRLHTGSSSPVVCFSPGGRRAYVLGAGGREILVLAGDRAQLRDRYRLKTVISQIALTRDGKTLLAESAAQDRLFFINAQDGHTLGSVQLGQDPGQMVVSPAGDKAFIADTGGETVSATDISTRQVLSQIEIGSMPSLLALKPDGGELFAASAQSSTLTILDVSSDSIEQNLPTGSHPVAAVFTSDSRVLYIANAGDGTVTTLDVQNRATVASTRVGIEPVALALTPDQRFLAVADRAAASVAVMRARVPALITTIPVGADPVDVAIPGWVWNSRAAQ